VEQSIAFIERGLINAKRRALVENAGRASYTDLIEGSARVATSLLLGRPSLEGARVAFLTEPGAEYVKLQWGIWRAGGIAVPLCPLHPAPELRYVVKDSGAERVVAGPVFEDLLRPVAEELGRPLSTPAELSEGRAGSLPDVRSDEGAMILYTSGTTSRPKGVLTTHDNIRAQIEALVHAWGWSAQDRILLVLPLHHLHGIINVLGCSLWSGACCYVHTSFDADRVWEAFGESELTLFMAVPTIYVRLIVAFDRAPESTRQRWARAVSRLRLMVSGSAALPVSVPPQASHPRTSSRGEIRLMRRPRWSREKGQTSGGTRVGSRPPRFRRVGRAAGP